MAIRRKQDWVTILHRHLKGRRDVTFSYDPAEGVDCATFVADAVQAMTDVDLAEEFRGKYKTQTGAFKAIKKITGGSDVEHVAEYVAKKYGLKEWPNQNFAQRGDLVIFDSPEGPALGIVGVDGRYAYFVGPNKLQAIKVTACRRAWRTS